MSSFASRFGTNYCPADDEIHEINALLEGPSAQLLEFDTKIAQLQKSIDSLIAQRSEVASFVAEHKALLAPIRRLPMEVLQAIFVACLPTERHAAMVAEDAPILLMQICNSWRQVALSTPRLYTRFHVDAVYTENPDYYPEMIAHLFQWRLSTMKLWISRSRSLPLSISLSGYTPTDTDATSIEDWRIFPFFAALLDAASQWGDIVLDIPEQMLDAPGFLALTPKHVPHLRRLELSPRIYSPDHKARWGNAPFFASRTLRSVHFDSPSLVSPISLPLQWATITDLTIRGPSWQLAFTLESLLTFLFPACSSLVYFTLSMSEYGRVLPVMGQIEAPALQTLTLYVHTNMSSPSLRALAYLSLPQLRHLRVFGAQTRGAQETLSRLAIERFFATCSKLRTICFNPDALMKHELQTLLRALPRTVKRLGLLQMEIYEPDEQQTLDDEVLRLLVDPTDVVPELEELSISNVQRVTDNAIHRFVLGRVASQQPVLKKAQFEFLRPPSSDSSVPYGFLGHPIVGPLIEARKLDLSFTYPPLPRYNGHPPEKVKHMWEGATFFEDENEAE
ncbi:hypothetical protein C8F01DRAFT_291805 [Mycena amicta]|nr:hypothetical protein C8F01DRAFT_291805 [Mycena amicta]